MSTIDRGTIAVLAVALISGVGYAQTCGQEFTFDVSPWIPKGVWGEAISLTTIQGEIINARVDATFISNEENPWSIYANFAFPTGITGVDSQTGGWKGTGTFTTSFETDALNGILVSPDVRHVASAVGRRHAQQVERRHDRALADGWLF